MRSLLPAFASAAAASPLARTPPMGWMSWEVFRCHGITAEFYQRQTDLLVQGGYLAAGYDTIHIDDCWEQKDPRRTDGQLVPDPIRFPKGMKALGDYMHAKGVKFGTYTDEGSNTCKGYPASAGNESVDAKTFASWGVDYLKVDGCGVPHSEYPARYHAMGDALVGSGRDIVYSCSWPAYIGSNETAKPFDDMIAAHCNLWRNWRDIQCGWGSLAAIIDHWGEFGEAMSKSAGPGHWHDPDMLLVGNACITDDEARTQLAIWSISAAPLIMGNNLSDVSPAARAILLNTDAIAVDQDSKGEMGHIVTPQGDTEVWARNLTGGAVAVALYNKNGGAEGNATSITADFAAVGLSGSVKVRDIWAQADLGVFTGKYTAASVPIHGSAFLRLTPVR